MKNQGIQHMTITPLDKEYMVVLFMEWGGKQKVLTEEYFEILYQNDGQYLNEEDSKALFGLLSSEMQEMYADDQSEAFFIIFRAIFRLLRNTLLLGYQESFVLSDKISVINERVTRYEYEIDAAFNAGWDSY